MFYTPTIIGVFKKDGVSYGQNRVNTGTAESPLYEIQGTATYPVNLTELNSFPSRVIQNYDYNGNPIMQTTIPSVDIAQTHQFGGWAIPVLA